MHSHYVLPHQILKRCFLYYLFSQCNRFVNGVVAGTLVLMYEQDMLQAKQLLSWDGKVRCQLNVAGIPQNVTKDFVNIFFPEALSVTSKLGVAQVNGR